LGSNAPAKHPSLTKHAGAAVKKKVEENGKKRHPKKSQEKRDYLIKKKAFFKVKFKTWIDAVDISKRR